MKKTITALILVLLLVNPVLAFTRHQTANWVATKEDLQIPLQSYTAVSYRGSRISALDYEHVVYEFNGNLYIADPERKIDNNKWLTQGTHPSWSPEGEWILFHHDSSIWKIRPDGTDRIKLSQGTSDSHPSWSFDGKMIIFKRVISDELEQIVISTMDLKNQRVVLELPAKIYNPKFFVRPDKIIFETTYENTPEMLIDDKPNTDLWLFDFNKDGIVRLTSHSAGSATIRREDNLIIYSQYFVFPNGFVGSNLRWMNPTTFEHGVLREGYIWHGYPNFDWTGNNLFFSVAHLP